ncbi:alpha-ketoglutarate-dependent dioxygenase AlkB family protein [Paroceanicella profunda]|uniref:alpha-ketoglutarate-dependent dioxygenase AlkB family protein n=1 Tax=Paroceanicella profunda TaxID=2579971 RepID=UPI0026B446B6
MSAIAVRGALWFRGFLDRAAQERLVDEIRAVVAAAPLFAPVTRRGQPLSVRMTSAGRCGWVSDRKGYRYEPRHPDGMPWPPLPPTVAAAWEALSGWPAPPDCCLVNWYDPGARMGLHQDRDEADFSAPVLSLSLGDTGVFRIGAEARGGRTDRIDLASGDALLLTGPSRLAHHGIARILPGTSTLLPAPGRINLTCRVVG